MGGAVLAGLAYRVGEAGPEMFIPRQSGTIVPNNAMGGDTFNVTVNVPEVAILDRPTAMQNAQVFADSFAQRLEELHRSRGN
jgi:hypothetical protein